MIIAQITGGLGNQMFQYSAAKALSLHTNEPLKLDLQSYTREVLPELEVPRDFELTAFENFTFQEATVTEIERLQPHNFLVKSLQKLLPPHQRKIYTEPGYYFDQNFFKTTGNVYLKGHRQSEKYFKPYTDQIRQGFQLKQEWIKDVQDFERALSTKNSVSVHIRRGDYLRLPIILDWHGVLGKDYYFNAIRLIKSKIPNPEIFYFSDDVEWVKQELEPVFGGTIVSENIAKSHYHDFHLMKSCQHQVIANSTFSWWAAWLNPNPGKIVVAPQKWFNKAPYDTRDLVPPEWIRV